MRLKMPETPKYLLARDKFKVLRQLLIYIARKNGNYEIVPEIKEFRFEDNF